MFANAAAYGNTDAIIGMPHRGRLGFLVSLMDYPARKLFHKVRGLSLTLLFSNSLHT